MDKQIWEEAKQEAEVISWEQEFNFVEEEYRKVFGQPTQETP